jgi:hypothetical protein
VVWFCVVQILANALPGFRDLRAPLIAGYMWLLFAWLWASPDLDRLSTGIGGSLHDLSQRAGPIWTGLAASVAAYLVGSLSQAGSNLAQQAILDLAPFRRKIRNLNFQTHQQIEAIGERAQLTIQSRDRDDPLDPGAYSTLNDQVARRQEEAHREAQRELDLPATLLVGDQADLFAEVDRVRAEGELRMAVLPPLVALGILLGNCVSLWWYLLLPAAGAVLFYQGIQRDIDAKKIISDAIGVGRVKAASVNKFSQWVNEGLPSEIERLRPSAADE